MPPINDIFITGTDTGVGKTVLSATLCAALDGTYWKPIQTGSADSDRTSVIRYAELPEARTIPSTYEFEPPVSPHLAARLAGTRIDLDAIQRPNVNASLVIEGAGGVMVPINEHDLMIDLMKRLNVPVLLAARTTLGTINHTLLSVQALRLAEVKLMGVVLIGEPNNENRRAIELYGNTPVIGWIPPLPVITAQVLIEVFAVHFGGSYFK